MNALVNRRARKLGAVLRQGILPGILFFSGGILWAQEEMTHEELMRRARSGLPPAPIATNPIVSPAPSVAPLRVPATPPPAASDGVKSAVADALRLKATPQVLRLPPATNPPVRVEPAPVKSLFVPPAATATAAAVVPPSESVPPFTPVSPRGNSKKSAPVFSDLPPDDTLFPTPTATAPTVSGHVLPAAAALSGASDPTNAMNALDEKYQLAIGDRLSFRIVEDEEGPKSLLVTDSGELEVPYIGRFRGVGRTCRELARALKAELEKEYYYQATVIIAVDAMTRSRGKVYLVGPVRAPGPLEVPSDEVLTLSKAILRAGGFTDFADRRNVKVTRKATLPGGLDETFTVNVAEILEKGKTDFDLPLEPGDLIYVNERTIRF